jgi:hypothetical protein
MAARLAFERPLIERLVFSDDFPARPIKGNGMFLG